MSITPDDTLTPAERAELAALPRERTPSSAVEGRVVAELRNRGAIRDVTTTSRRPNRWRLLVAAAAVALFASGFGAGRLSGSGSMVAGPAPAGESGPAWRVRQAGSEYVRAITLLADSSATPDRDVIVSTLGDIAAEVLRVAPDDPIAASILSGLEWRRRAPEPNSTSGTARRVAWF